MKNRGMFPFFTKGEVTMKYACSGALAGLIATSILCAAPVMAEWSDYYARESAAQNSASSALNHGGTYSQAGRNYINNQKNWEIPDGTGQGGQSAEMTPEERVEYERVMQNTNRMLNNMYNQPHNFGPQPRPMSADEKTEFDRSMQRSDDLMRQIENDPMFK